MASGKFEEQDMAETSFYKVNLFKAHFEDVNLAESVIHNVNLKNVTIYDANIEGMTIFGVRVDKLVEAELDRLEPMRIQLRMADIHDLNEIRRIYAVWKNLRADFIQELKSLPSEIINQRPGPDRWSALEHLRHLVYVEECYLNRGILRNDKPWCKLGFLPPFLVGRPGFEDVGSAPTQNLDKVVSALLPLHQELLHWIDQAQLEDLMTDTREVAFGLKTVGDILQLLPQHELIHIRMAEKAIADVSVAV